MVYRDLVIYMRANIGLRIRTKCFAGNVILPKIGHVFMEEGFVLHVDVGNLGYGGMVEGDAGYFSCVP